METEDLVDHDDALDHVECSANLDDDEYGEITNRAVSKW
jgi:hypothetical protein